MLEGEEIKDFIIAGLDITSYALKTLAQQRSAQDRVDRCLQEAVQAHRPKRQLPLWLDAGDGGYALFDWGEREVLGLLTDFYARLARVNAEVTPENRVVVRIALHKGQIICWRTKLGSKYTSTAINDCARLLTGMSRKHESQVVCSGEFFKAISTLDEVAKAVRLRDIEDKHGGQHEVWNLRREPGFGVHPDEPEKHLHPLKRG
ncbi:MAG TPA: hypothetical protein VIT45_12745 [Allosphingosinicella sp.]